MKRHLLLVALLSGCANTYIAATPINAAPHALARRPPDQVEVWSAGRPERPFVDVAYLLARVSGEGAFDNVVADLRERAGAMGCDGIVFNGHDSSNHTSLDFSATCIVYR